MSKIICDVCGTSYPETAEQCPICGCVRPADAPGVSGSTEEKASGYTYVKGGRFSKANVRKRTGAAQAVARETEEKEKSGKGLVITAVVLLLAILAVVGYIAYRFLGPSLFGDDLKTTTPTTVDTQDVPCEDLYLDVRRMVFSEAGESRMLYATPWPSNATETVYFESSDEDIVTVNSNGKVTAVAPGEAWITVTCGDVTAICDVECAFEIEESTEETTEATEETTVPLDVELKLNRSDITFSYKGETWLIYSGDIPLSSIKWSSGNESVCTIENGKVVAESNGTTNVYAEYGDQKVSCIIRCYFNAEGSGSGVSGNGGVSGDGGG